MGLVTNAVDLDKMRAACRDAAKILDFLTPYVLPGVTTGELDQICLKYLTEELKVKSATVGYAPPGYTPFPGAICTSVNHQVCHGIPGDRKIEDGDVVAWDGDDLEMSAAAGRSGEIGTATPVQLGEAAVAALAAGCDLLITTGTYQRQLVIRQAIVDAVTGDSLSRERLDQAVERVLALKAAHSLPLR